MTHLDEARAAADAVRAELKEIEDGIAAGLKKADEMMAEREQLLRDVEDLQRDREVKIREVSRANQEERIASQRATEEAVAEVEEEDASD